VGFVDDLGQIDFVEMVYSFCWLELQKGASNEESCSHILYGQIRISETEGKLFFFLMLVGEDTG
jgi:hypothetical protein